FRPEQHGRRRTCGDRNRLWRGRQTSAGWSLAAPTGERCPRRSRNPPNGPGRTTGRVGIPRLQAGEDVKATRSDSLRRARSEGLDGYYVQLADVERGLYPFRDHFRGKTVLLNCDDTFGGFWTYFRNNLDFLGIERVIGVGYEPGGQGRVSELRLADGPDAVATRALAGDGDFRSDEVVDLLGQADIVATTPPSSLFPEHLAQAVEHGKGFVTLGAQSSAAYRDVWPMILSGDAWVMPHPGRGTVVFEIPEDAPAGRWGYRETAGGKR